MPTYEYRCAKCGEHLEVFGHRAELTHQVPAVQTDAARALAEPLARVQADAQPLQTDLSDIGRIEAAARSLGKPYDERAGAHASAAAPRCEPTDPIWCESRDSNPEGLAPTGT